MAANSSAKQWTWRHKFTVDALQLFSIKLSFCFDHGRSIQIISPPPDEIHTLIKFGAKRVRSELFKLQWKVRFHKEKKNSFRTYGTIKYYQCMHSCSIKRGASVTFVFDANEKWNFNFDSPKVGFLILSGE